MQRPEDLPQRVLCFAHRPGDEVAACGGMLAFHAQRGDTVCVVIVGGGEPGPGGGARRGEAEAASRRAAQGLALGDVQFLDLDPGLDGRDLEARLQRVLEEFDPELVYAPSPLEPDRAARGASRALLGALRRGPRRSVLVYGLERPLPTSASFDTTAYWDRKAKALEAFAGLRQHDWLATIDARDRGCVGVLASDGAERAASDGAERAASDGAERAASDGAERAASDGAERAASDGAERAASDGAERNGSDRAEAFVALASDGLQAFEEGAERMLFALEEERGAPGPEIADAAGLPRTTAVVSTWNKKEDLRENLRGLLAQRLPFESIVVVDNASTDGTAEMVARDFPEVRLVVMPNSRYGACETFNIGFASVTSELLAILDDDIVMPPDWLEKTTRRLLDEPSSTAVISTKIVEPGMPDAYRDSPALNRERYMSTFRGCASLARTRAVAEVGGYDERLFIYGNERDMTCRLLNRGYRVLQYPAAEVFHKTPFGIKMGKRSLYYHARNAFLSMLKYAPLGALFRMPLAVVRKVLLRGADQDASGDVTDATGTIGIGRSLRETPGAPWILFKAGCSVLANVPYCLRRREVCRAEDFELPLE